MEKISFELFRIHKSCKVKFCLILKDDNPKSFTKLVNKFTLMGNTYIKVTPFPYLTIDISNTIEQKEEWNANRTFNLNRKDLFMFRKKLTQLLKDFISNKDLFYYENDKLMLNKQRADQIKQHVQCGNKIVVLWPAVIENNEDHQSYEGIFMMVNSIDYFTYLTYSELEFLLSELQKIDMNNLTLQIINTAKLYETLESSEIKKKEPIAEPKEDEIVDIKPIKKEESTIPEI